MLQLLDLLLRPENGLFELSQLLGDEPLGVYQGLLAEVVRRERSALEGRLGDLDVEAEDLVEADSEGGNLSAFPLFLFEAGDLLFSRMGQPPKVVQLLVVPLPEDPAVGKDQGRRFGQSPLDLLPQILQGIDLLEGTFEKRAFGLVRPGGEGGKGVEGGGQSGQVPRRGGLGRELRRESV